MKLLEHQFIKNLNFNQKRELLCWAFNKDFLILPQSFYYFYWFADLLEKLKLMNNNYVYNYFSNLQNQEYYLEQINDLIDIGSITIHDLSFLKINIIV